MKNEYKIILYYCGRVIYSKIFHNIEDARNFYYKNDSYDQGIRLYVNNKPLKIHEAEKLLGGNPCSSSWGRF